MDAITVHLWAEIPDYLGKNELSVTIYAQRFCCKHKIVIGQEARENRGLISNIPVC